MGSGRSGLSTWKRRNFRDDPDADPLDGFFGNVLVELYLEMALGEGEDLMLGQAYLLAPSNPFSAGMGHRIQGQPMKFGAKVARPRSLDEYDLKVRLPSFVLYTHSSLRAPHRPATSAAATGRSRASSTSSSSLSRPTTFARASSSRTAQRCARGWRRSAMPASTTPTRRSSPPRSSASTARQRATVSARGRPADCSCVSPSFSLRDYAGELTDISVHRLEVDGVSPSRRETGREWEFLYLACSAGPSRLFVILHRV